MAEWTDVALEGEIQPGTSKVVDVDDVMIAVFNLNGELFAIEDLCTHDYEPLTGGLINGCEITCPRHGARFNLKTGEALSPPAYEPVTTFPVRCLDGVIQVIDGRWD